MFSDYSVKIILRVNPIRALGIEPLHIITVMILPVPYEGFDRGEHCALQTGWAVGAAVAAGI